MAQKPIVIFGDGIAGLTAAQILSRLGHAVVVTTGGAPRSRRVALNGASRFLLERIWDQHVVNSSSSHMLQRRILFWEGKEPVVLDERALVVDVASLAVRMKSVLKCNGLVAWRTEDAVSTPDIVATRSDDGDCYLTGGTRTAVQADVLLNDSADLEALHVESVASGWLVILPVGGGEGTVMAVAADKDTDIGTLLAESSYSRRVVRALGASSASVSAAPQLFVSSRFAAAAMRIGEPAMRFDPISGDGVAGALRGAHLVSLLLDRRVRSLDNVDIKSIYEERLARAMRAHLGGLVRLYSTAPLAKCWASELRAMETMEHDIDELWPDREARVAVMENSLTALGRRRETPTSRTDGLGL